MNDQQQPQMNVDFSQTTAEVCEKCENDVFIVAYKVRKLSALLSPTGEKSLIPVQLFACAECGNINSTFKPQED
tara:strand:- start:314 stop:535 length:222 start_codon:yes stop_codon:yes gene_type:complete